MHILSISDAKYAIIWTCSPGHLLYLCFSQKRAQKISAGFGVGCSSLCSAEADESNAESRICARFALPGCASRDCIQFFYAISRRRGLGRTSQRSSISSSH